MLSAGDEFPGAVRGYIYFKADARRGAVSGIVSDRGV